MSAFAVRNSELRVHQLGEDDDVVVLGADALESFACGFEADTLHAVEEGVQRVGEGEVVIDGIKCRVARRAVLESKIANAGLDLSRRRQRLQDFDRDSSARAGTRKRVNAKPLTIAPPIFIRIELLYPAAPFERASERMDVFFPASFLADKSCVLHHFVVPLFLSSVLFPSRIGVNLLHSRNAVSHPR